MSLCVTLGNIVPKTVALKNVGLKTVTVTGLNHNFYCFYYKNYDFVPFPLPSHYRPVTIFRSSWPIMTLRPSSWHSRPSPFRTLPHRSSPSLRQRWRTVRDGKGRWGTVRVVEGRCKTVSNGEERRGTVEDGEEWNGSVTMMDYG